MKCHYELLELERDADPEEIKKSYRKLALKWHPDKNPEKVEECTQYFALLQQAYEVLSDPRERDFYDRHRESILKGGFDGDEGDKSVDLFKYFSASCYKLYEDDAKGFFTIYRKVFQTLANEDYDQMDKYEDKNYPEFGDSKSDYDKVVGPFYGFWSSFSTIRSFAWLEKYDIRQAENRWQTRQVEQENKKYRDAGKQERNDQIRQLVAFVRKRDPRVRAYREVLEQKQVEAKKKQEENRKKQIIQNQMQLNSYLEDKEAEAKRLAHLMEVSLQMNQDYDTCSDECDEDGKELPYCVVCNKSFKTQNAKTNHENSKLHIKQLAELKKHMKDEDAELFESSRNDESTESPQQQQKGGKKAKKNRKKKGNGIFGCDEDDEADKNEIGETEPTAEIVSEVVEPEQSEAPSESVVVDEPAKKEKKKRRADKTNKSTAKDESDNEEDGKEQKTGKCDRCKQVFDSRSKLFAHLKETGHATLLVNKKAEPKKKNKKGRRGADDAEDW